MKQYEAVIKVMERSGGYATLSHLYQHVLKERDVQWKTKTPYASIRRIVQDERFFFKMKPGLWALKEQREKVLKRLKILDKTPEKMEIFTHTYYQGLLVELGNLRSFETYVPNQDKNKNFLERPLKEITKIENIYQFSYDSIVKHARTVDVIWFNKRKLPNSFFEVEHSGDIYNSLRKFIELQDFFASFYIVSDKSRFREFKEKMSSSTCEPMRARIEFFDYDKLADYHSKMTELSQLGFQL